MTDCPSCSQEACLDPREVRLLVPLDVFRCARVVFTCPACGRRAAVGVTDPIADALRATGIVAVSWGHPSLGRSVRTAVQGPAFTHDDLLDLHLLLQQDDWFERLAGLPAR